MRVIRIQRAEIRFSFGGLCIQDIKIRSTTISTSCKKPSTTLEDTGPIRFHKLWCCVLHQHLPQILFFFKYSVNRTTKSPCLIFLCGKTRTLMPKSQGTEMLGLDMLKYMSEDILLRAFWQNCHLWMRRSGRDDQTWEFVYCFVKSFLLPTL